MASLGQLTAGIAHEINNPINFIRGNSEALELDFQDLQGVLQQLKEAAPSEEDRPAIRQLLETAKNADLPFLLEEMRQLINDLKMGSSRVAEIVSELKIFTHPSEGEQRPEDLKLLLDSALTILNNKIKEKHIEVRKDVPPLPRGVCQAGKISQAFLNILDNAIEVVDEGGHTHVTARQVGEHLQYDITDNGHGMDEATLGKVFELFFTTKEVGQGTGLGLAITYGIIKELGGDIRIESSPGKGTTVRMLIPLQPRQADSGDDLPPAEQAG